MTMITAVFNQQNFRFRTVSPLTAAANAAFNASDPALNAAVNLNASANVAFRIRFEIEETAGGSENVTWNLYCSRNGGTYFVVNNLSTIVRTSDNTTYADDTATTNLIAGSARAFLAGYADDSDAIMPNAGNQSWSGNQHTELDVACTVLSANVNHGDTLDFQIRKSGGTTITYTRMPRITVTKVVTVNLAGNSSGAGSVSGALTVIAIEECAGTSAGVGTVTAALTNFGFEELEATTSGTSTVTADLDVAEVQELAVTTSGGSSATGAATLIYQLEAALAGAGLVTGTLSNVEIQVEFIGLVVTGPPYLVPVP